MKARTFSFRDMFATAWPIILISALGFIFAYQFVKPAPPDTLTITTGGESGAYYGYAKRYAEILKAKGITLEIMPSAGSKQNLERIVKGDADVAFIQGGITETLANGEDSELRSLGSVSYEPVWVFYRGDKEIDRLYQFKDKRIAIGPDGSGLRDLALQLLAANQIASDSKNLQPITGLEAARALKQGKIDVAFAVAAQEAPFVQELLHSPGIRVMNFGQAEAYRRRLPFLSSVILPRGVVDLVQEIPPHNVTLLATTANVIVRDDLHPALASLLLQAITEINGSAGFFQHSGEFPSYKDHNFILSSEAERYFKSGPPFLQRYLPFWIAVLVDRLFVLIVPIVILFLPLLRVAPLIYSWRVKSRIFRSYGDLKFLEHELRLNYDPARRDEYLERLDRIEEDAYERNIPLAFSDLLYTLREHINLVRDKLNHLDSDSAPDHKT